MWNIWLTLRQREQYWTHRTHWHRIRPWNPGVSGLPQVWQRRRQHSIRAYMRLKKSNDTFWRKKTWNYRNKTSNRTQLRVYHLEGLVYKLGIGNITFVCLWRQTTSKVKGMLTLQVVLRQTSKKKKKRTLALILNSRATFSTTSGASAELLITSNHQSVKQQ